MKNPHLKTLKTCSIGENSPICKYKMIRWGKFLDHGLNCHQNGQFTPAKAGGGIAVFSFKGDLGRRSFRYTSSSVCTVPSRRELTS